MTQAPSKGPKPTEAEFQKSVIGAATALGWKWHHEVFSLGTKPGYPDLTLAHPNHGVLWLELKGPRGKVHPAQQDWIDWLQLCGQDAYIVWWDQWDVIEDLLNGREVKP